MDDYISREEAMKAYREQQGRSGPWRFETLINSVPVSDVRPIVHGKWILTKKMADGGRAHCSVCGKEMVFNSFRPHTSYNFCPNCGADMRGKK